MMFERFTDTAREIVVQAQANARRLGHNWIGCEHLLMGAAMTDDPVGAVLRDHGVTRDRIEATILSTMGQPRELDKEALASIGIDLDAVRARVEAAFGPDALTRPLPAESHGRRRRHAGHNAPQPAGPVGNAQPLSGPPPRGHIPFTPRAKKTIELSLREAEALHDSSIGAQHITLALLIPQDGTVARILAALDVQPASLRAAILDRYRKAS
jgi:ATP-dependent Clp protease ATP-binding subunit ClpA